MTMMTRCPRWLLEKSRPLDLDKVDHWMSQLIQDKGEDLLRYKGILYVQGLQAARCIPGSAHALLREARVRKWKETETKVSELVFIGKDLNKKELEQQFKNCIAN